MPLKPSAHLQIGYSGPGYTSRSADALFGSAPRYSRRTRVGAVTHDDLMPSAINSHELVKTGEIAYASRRDYLGTFAFDGRFIKWLDEGALPRRVREERLRPADWWQSAYLVSRVEAGCGRDATRAVVTLHQIRASFREWVRLEWDECDDEAYEAREQQRDRQLARLAATTCGGGHDVEYLDRLAKKLQSYVWQTFYPSNRQRALQQAQAQPAQQQRQSA